MKKYLVKHNTLEFFLSLYSVDVKSNFHLFSVSESEGEESKSRESPDNVESLDQNPIGAARQVFEKDLEASNTQALHSSKQSCEFLSTCTFVSLSTCTFAPTRTRASPPSRAHTHTHTHALHIASQLYNPLIVSVWSRR